MMCLPRAALAAALLCWFATEAAGQRGARPDRPAAGSRNAPVAEIPPPRQTYFGRRIAQTMHYLGAEWLIRDSREREERCSLMLTNLGLKPGMTVCDMGCGNGFHTLQLAEIVGPQGTVLAVDIQPEMLDLLRDRLQARQIKNVTPILGQVHDPQLPRGAVDLILLVDVYHEFSHPELMLRAMRDALAPEGVMVLVEFRAEDASVPIKPLHKMSQKQIMKEIPPNGFRLVHQFDRLPWQHMLFFARQKPDGGGQGAGTPEER